MMKKKLLIFLLIIVILLFFQKPIKNFFYSLSFPIQSFFWSLGSPNNSCVDLERQNQELLSQIALLKEAEQENIALRKALGLGLEKQFELSLADVFSKNQDSILINKGEEDGVIKDRVLITEEKALAGKIDEVYINFSRAVLLSNEKSMVSAKIQDKDIQGLIKGRDRAIVLEFLPQKDKLEKGDIVLTSGMDGLFPANLLIGEVKEIFKQDVDPLQEAEVSSFFDISRGNKVFLIND